MIIEGKVALITGGVGGLGKAFAIALLKAKAKVVCLVDISNNGEQVASELQNEFSQSTVNFYHCDVTDYEQFKGAFEHLKKYGGVDIVCNNAGIAAEDTNFARSVKVLRINLEAVYYGTQLGMEYMDKSKDTGRGGVIVNIASIAAYLSLQSAMCYNAAKSGVVGLTRSAGLSDNYEKFGVRVNALCPWYTETPILDQNEGMREAVAQAPGLDRQILEPEFVAEGFLQLIQDEELCGACISVTPHSGIVLVGEKRSSAKFVPGNYVL